jgi:hypothetical protein
LLEIQLVILLMQLALTPFVMQTLWTTRRQFGVSTREWISVVSTMVLAAVTVLLLASFFPDPGALNEWARQPTGYYRLLVESRFDFPQERSLSLLMLLYVALSAVIPEPQRRTVEA